MTHNHRVFLSLLQFEFTSVEEAAAVTVPFAATKPLWVLLSSALELSTGTAVKNSTALPIKELTQ